MNPLSLWPIPVVFGLMLATAWVLTKWLRPPPITGRFGTLDGLRGFLAFGVFIHHGAVWYFYLRTGKWEHPASNVYANLGEDSVALFFMITGFLFWTKLLDGREKVFDWTRLYVSRVLRLTPLYLFALIVGGLFLAIATDFQLREPVTKLAGEIARWSSFTILGSPPVNGFENDYVVLGGVTWTLPYEWLFYVALPLFGVVVGVKTPWYWSVGALLATVFIARHIKPDMVYLAAFAGGIMTANLVRIPAFCARARHLYATAFAVLALGWAWYAYANLHTTPALLLLTVAFAIITAGNTLGGILTWPATRLAGEISYSVYLLHGLLLYAVFRFLIGTPRAASFSALEHWLVVFACVPVTVLVCCLTFRWIEDPAMRRTAKVTNWIHRRTGGKAS